MNAHKAQNVIFADIKCICHVDWVMDLIWIRYSILRFDSLVLPVQNWLVSCWWANTQVDDDGLVYKALYSMNFCCGFANCPANSERKNQMLLTLLHSPRCSAVCPSIQQTHNLLTNCCLINTFNWLEPFPVGKEMELKFNILLGVLISCSCTRSNVLVMMIFLGEWRSELLPAAVIAKLTRVPVIL